MNVIDWLRGIFNKSPCNSSDDLANCLGMAKDTEFELVFDGPGLEDGSIDVYQLAPSLMALGDLVSEAAKVVPDAPKDATVRVLPTFKHGSFEVVMYLGSTALAIVHGTARGLGDGDAFKGYKRILEIIGIVKKDGEIGFLQLLQKKPQQMKIIEKEESTRTTILEFPNGVKFRTSDEAIRLLNIVKPRRAARALVSPLDQTGIDKLEIREKGRPSITVIPDDVEAFEVPDLIDPIDKRKYETEVVFTTIHFDPSKKIWRVHDINEDTTFNASIEDQDFMKDVLKGEVKFGKRTKLNVVIRETRFSRNGRLRTTRVIERILRDEDKNQRTLGNAS